jgi:VanZ family protein
MAHAGSSSVYHRLALAVFALAVIIVAVLLMTPAQALPETALWDKLEHAGAFAGLAFLGFLAFPARAMALRMVLGLIAFGTMCEPLQMFVPGRSVSVKDALANALGVLIVAGVWWLGHLLVDRRSADS